MCVSAPKPKVPAVTPVIERQPYREPVSRAALASGGDSEARRRMIAGVVTGAMGDTSTASTTRNPQPAPIQKIGGDQQLQPSLSSGVSPITTQPDPIPTRPRKAGQGGSPSLAASVAMYRGLRPFSAARAA